MAYNIMACIVMACSTCAKGLYTFIFSTNLAMLEFFVKFNQNHDIDRYALL